MRTYIMLTALVLAQPAYSYDDHDRAHQNFVNDMNRQADERRALQAQQDIAEELRRQNDLNERSQRNNDGNPFNGGALQGDGFRDRPSRW